MINPLRAHLKIAICDNADDAKARGYNYADGTFKPIQVNEVVRLRTRVAELEGAIRGVLPNVCPRAGRTN